MSESLDRRFCGDGLCENETYSGPCDFSGANYYTDGESVDCRGSACSVPKGLSFSPVLRNCECSAASIRTDVTGNVTVPAAARGEKQGKTSAQYLNCISL